SFEEITPNVVFAQNDQGSNSACIALETELIFVDAGMNATKAAAFRKAMEDKFKRKTSTLLCTHGHIDHFLAMGAFADVKVIAAEQSKARFEKFVTAEFTEQLVNNLEQYFPGFIEAAKVAKLFMPHEWVNDTITMGKDNEIIFKVTGGHSSCSSSIHFIPEKVVFAGDLMQVDGYPYFGEPDTDLTKWIQSLKQWEAMDLVKVIPGHGKAVGTDYVANVRVYFEEIVKLISEQKKQNIPIEEVIQHPKFDEGYWPEHAPRKSSYNYSIGVIYNMIE
ncbi:MAG: MBL fold metallo-hydrolase, partial [Candidatus Heimdallarchaeota archaeon]